MADSQPLRERTLVVLKPDAVARGLAGRIIQRFEDASLKIIGMKMRELDADFARKHYFDLEERLGSTIYNATAAFMQRGPVIAFVIEGEDAVATVRKIVGSTYPERGPAGFDPGRLRTPVPGDRHRDRPGGREPGARLGQPGGSGVRGRSVVRQDRAVRLPHHGRGV